MKLLEFLFGKRRPRISLRDLNHKLDLIMSSQTELATQVRAATTQLQKISKESTATLATVEKLKEIIAQENVSPELQAAVAELAAQVQAVDDLTPDIVETPPAETPPV